MQMVLHAVASVFGAMLAQEGETQDPYIVLTLVFPREG